jgi:hypothetical protein
VCKMRKEPSNLELGASCALAAFLVLPSKLSMTGSKKLAMVGKAKTAIGQTGPGQVVSFSSQVMTVDQACANNSSACQSTGGAVELYVCAGQSATTSCKQSSEIAYDLDQLR